MHSLIKRSSTVRYPDKYTRAIKIRDPLDRLNGFIYIVYLTAIRTKSLTINIVNTDGWRSHSHGGDSTLHKLSIFHHRVYMTPNSRKPNLPKLSESSFNLHVTSSKTKFP